MRWNLPEGRTAQILLVEDNPDDVVLTEVAFGRLCLPTRLHHVGDGEACLRFLRRQAPWTDAPPVDLVVLDLNLPRMDGRATLAALVADPALTHVPVVVLTTSTREPDVEEMYRLRCGGYVVKPVDIDRFFEVIEQLCAWWFSAVLLPRPGTRG